jgi:hypothetical protein
MHNLYRNKELLKIFGIIVASCVLLIFFVHFFYSEFPEKTKKINANILIVEGWLPTPALEKAKYEFQHDGYDILIITGLNFTENYYQVSMDRKNRIINNFNSNAEQTRNELIRMGVDPSRIVAVPAEGTNINRTLKSALAFRDWLKESKCQVKGINIISFGPHARRKWMIYDKILGKNYSVGIIYLPDYDNHNFLREIFKELREFFGLVYYWIILIFY